MLPILTAAQMKAADQKTIEQIGIPARTLMERAATAALTKLESAFDTTLTLILCGAGNNGGDGLAMARMLAQKSKRVRVLLVTELTDAKQPNRAKMSIEAAAQFAALPGDVEVILPCNEEDLSPAFADVTCIVDALFGIGLSRAVEGLAAVAIGIANNSGLPILAIDLPSGIATDTGAVLGTAIRAQHTVAMAYLKPGHLLYPGCSHCGEIAVADIGIAADLISLNQSEARDLRFLPHRPEDGHKGSFGRVLIVGGSVGMSGAGYFAAKAAYRCGAGLVEIFAPEENRIIYQTQLPEALLALYAPLPFDGKLLTRALKRADAVAVGMGLGTDETARHIVSIAIEQSTVPLVLDADALNILAKDDNLMRALKERTTPAILTPHVGEAARLLHTDTTSVRNDLIAAAREIANRTKCAVVLKSARTVTSDGNRAVINTNGNNGMATGGSGDVLAGILAALTVREHDSLKAAYQAVTVHALAGDAAVHNCGKHGLMASDIIDALPQILP